MCQRQPFLKATIRWATKMIRQISALAAAALTILLAGAALAADPTATTDCFTCSTLDMMQQLRDQFNAGLFDEIASLIKPLVKSLLAVYIVLIALKGMAIGEMDVKTLVLRVVALIFIISTLFGGGGSGLVGDYLIAPCETTALSLASHLITHVGTNTVSASADVSSYSGLMQLVEDQVGAVLEIFPALADPDGDGTIKGQIKNLVAAILLLLPYLFIVALFCGFLVEAFFEIFAMQAIAPILIAGFLFPASRGWAKAGVKIVINASFTIVLLGLAFSLASQPMKKLIDTIHAGLSLQSEFDSSRKYLTQACQPPLTVGEALFGGDLISDHAKTPECDAAAQKVQELQGHVFAYAAFDRTYFGYLSFGIVVVILHLKSRIIASNLTATTGGSPVGAVVGAAAAMGAAGALLIGQRGLSAANVGLFGGSGLGGYVSEKIGNTPLAGGAVRSATSLFNAMGSGAGDAADAVTPPSTGGGGRGGGFSAMPPDMSQAFTNLSKTLDQIAKNTKPGGDT